MRLAKAEFVSWSKDKVIITGEEDWVVGLEINDEVVLHSIVCPKHARNSWNNPDGDYRVWVDMIVNLILTKIGMQEHEKTDFERCLHEVLPFLA